MRTVDRQESGHVQDPRRLSEWVCPERFLRFCGSSPRSEEKTALVDGHRACVSRRVPEGTVTVRCFEDVGEKRKVVRRLTCEEQSLQTHRTATLSGPFLFQKKTFLFSILVFSFQCHMHDSELIGLLSFYSPAFYRKAKMVLAKQNQNEHVLICYFIQ